MKPRSAQGNQAIQGGLVYSTQGGRMCPACRQALAQCQCQKNPAQPKGSGAVRVWQVSRAGKAITLVKDLPLAHAELAALGKQLKTACGSGGTVKDGVIEIQGHHAQRVLDWLKSQGWAAAKRAGA
jgi:translation initiation factor 1